MQALSTQDMPRVYRPTGAGLLASFCHPRRVAHTRSAQPRPFTCAGSPEQDLQRIRFRKGLVSFKERNLRRSRQVAPPVIEAVADVEQQVSWAAGRKLRRALDFREWTPRGKGLVLLNVLVRPCNRVRPRDGR